MLVGTGIVRWTRPDLSVFCLLTIILSPALGSVQASYQQNPDCVSGKGKGCLDIAHLLKMEIRAWPLEAYEMQAV